MIQFTPAAMEHLRACLDDGEFARVGVQGGGCSGMNYALNVETEFDEEDILLDIPGVKVYIDPYSADILNQTTVDYVTSLQREGFVFMNPRANTTCGCGSSFS
jgi:iron-sulfur cluster assembly protein